MEASREGGGPHGQHTLGGLSPCFSPTSCFRVFSVLCECPGAGFAAVHSRSGKPGRSALEQENSLGDGFLSVPWPVTTTVIQEPPGEPKPWQRAHTSSSARCHQAQAQKTEGGPRRSRGHPSDHGVALESVAQEPGAPVVCRAGARAPHCPQGLPAPGGEAEVPRSFSRASPDISGTPGARPAETPITAAVAALRPPWAQSSRCQGGRRVPAEALKGWQCVPGSPGQAR